MNKKQPIGQRLSYAHPVTFLGRNGETKQNGLLVSANEETYPEQRVVVWFEPITSKHKVGRCRIEIPLAQVAALIETLQILHDKHTGRRATPVGLYRWDCDALYYALSGEFLGEINDGKFVRSQFLLELPPTAQQDIDRFVQQFLP